MRTLWIISRIAFQKSDDNDDDELVLDDPGFSLMEIITILQAQNDILFLYLPSGLSVDQADGKVIFTGMKDAKERYLKNKELMSDKRECRGRRPAVFLRLEVINLFGFLSAGACVL